MNLISSKEPAIKKINAYGIKREGSKAILEILNDVQGYSRKLEVVQKKLKKKVSTSRKINNGYEELQQIGFIHIINDTSDERQRIKIDKRVWERDSNIIKHEHKLIYTKLNQSGRWQNPKKIIHDIRNLINKQYGVKPSYYSVEAHLKLFLKQQNYHTNEKSHIRLSKFSKNNTTIRNIEVQDQLLLNLNSSEIKQKNLNDNKNIFSTDDDADINLNEDDDIFKSNFDDNSSEVSLDKEIEISEDIFKATNSGFLKKS